MTEATVESLRRVTQEVSALRALGRRLRAISLKATLVRQCNALQPGGHVVHATLDLTQRLPRTVMAHLPWVDFLQLHSSPHLVAAIIVPSRSSNHLLRLRRILASVIDEGRPVADFATAIVRPTEVAQIHCAFVDKSDADRLARLAQARLKPADPPWASYRAFTLGSALELALADRLPSTKRRPTTGSVETT